MANPIKLAINRQNRTLVAFGGSVTSVPDLFQSNVQDFQIQVVDPNPADPINNPYTAVDLNGFGLRMAIGDTPTGSSGGPTPLALQDATGWTWSAVNKWFSGNIALNTSGIDTFIGTAATKPAYLELNLTVGGSRSTLFQAQFNLRAVVDELSSTSPTPTDQYLTKGDCLALFAKLIGDLGQRQVFRSANGVYGRELGVNDDGTAIDNIITL